MFKQKAANAWLVISPWPLDTTLCMTSKYIQLSYLSQPHNELDSQAASGTLDINIEVSILSNILDYPTVLDIFHIGILLSIAYFLNGHTICIVIR